GVNVYSQHCRASPPAALGSQGARRPRRLQCLFRPSRLETDPALSSGKSAAACRGECAEMLSVQIYRDNPEVDAAPRMQTYVLDAGARKLMVLDVLEALKAEDATLTFRRSCREGVCGSDGMNINGKNGLACMTRVSEALKGGDVLILRPLTGMPVIRDLIVDMDLFFRQYKKIRPWLINDTPAPSIERLQSPQDRARLDGLYECILCACCTSGCPSWWWNPDRFIGPAGLLS